MKIHQENHRDITAVQAVETAAFGQKDEADLVDGLRASGDAVISLVVEEAGEIVGHILFSKLEAPDRCLALAPVAVMPDLQREGIGARLIRAGLVRAKESGAKAVFVLGDPEYYTRFGFDVSLAAKFETEYPKEYFMALELERGALVERDGPVIYAPPFRAMG